MRTAHKPSGSPHGSRPHGHDRSLALCVNDPACCQSTPVLQSTPWPEEDLSLLGRHMATPPASNVQLSTSGVLSTRGFWIMHTARVLLVQGVRLLWRRVGCTGIGILARETPATFGWGSPDHTSVLTSGSRRRAVKTYVLGPQPCVQKDIIKEAGRPRDVKTQAQVSKKVVWQRCW
jgi:hypothetical protein